MHHKLIKQSASNWANEVQRQALMAYLAGLGTGTYGYLTADPDVSNPAHRALTYGLLGGAGAGIGLRAWPHIADNWAQFQQDLRESEIGQ